MNQLLVMNTIILGLLLAFPIISCNTARSIAVSEVDPNQLIVVEDDDGTLYRLPSWRADETGNILGSSTIHLPGTVTANELLASGHAWLGDPFQGAIPCSKITKIYSLRDSPSPATTIIAFVLATAGVLAFVFAVGISGGLMWAHEQRTADDCVQTPGV